ncbi:hypothetical protein E1B22_12590 (plasmid) [Thermaerobacter sp. FW80]|uniref:hypothetical protein n=1 Tax=Thermaerobacter sp. FW80 TaxID=2546351 RepID=UPI001075652F|nr:hypothetical protein [Thermaerobacter sp. FW80]QBS38737.1 hypothetical protein E1B22_12550 [Thermaerobacter sp. FW80]QBS38744.1 hypothetical protein E1B22_12590 [Thermaerobacter sp. FW80]
MNLRSRVERLEKKTRGLVMTLATEDGATVRCTWRDVAGAYCESIQAAREGRMPSHPFLPTLLRAMPGQDPFVDLARGVARQMIEYVEALGDEAEEAEES